MTKTQKWREVVAVHPAAEVFPLMNAEDLKKLAEDIKYNGLRHEIVTYEKGSKLFVLDGRNRLDAMELLGEQILTPDGEFIPRLTRGTLSGDVGGADPASIVISANIRRRHLSKRQQSDLIVAAIKATKDQAKPARSLGAPKGQKGGGGSTKDPVKEQVVTEAAKHGISERTARQALVDAEPERKRPQEKKKNPPKTTKTKKPTPRVMLKADKAAAAAVDALENVLSQVDNLSETGLKKHDKARLLVSAIDEAIEDKFGKEQGAK